MIRTAAFALAATALFAQHPAVLAGWKAANEAGSAALEAGNRALAEQKFRAAVLAAGKLPGRGEELAVSLTNLGQVLVEERKFPEALQVLNRACLSWKRLEGGKQNYALALGEKAGALEGLGRGREAEAAYREALRITEEVFGPTHENVATLLNNLAVLDVAQHRYAESKSLITRAEGISKLHNDELGRATALNNLAAVNRAEKQYAESERLFLEAKRIRESELGTDHPDVALVLSNLANLYQDQKRFKDAEALYRRALTIDEKSFGPDSPVAREDVRNIAALYTSMGDPVRAREFLARADRRR